MPPLVRLEPFLLHESSMVRDSVGFHFFQTWPDKEDLAPLVLEACRRYGDEPCMNLLSFGCRFPLSARGLLEALRALADIRPPFVEQWVSLAPLSLTRGRAEVLRSVLSRRAIARLDRRTCFHDAAPEELWRRLSALSRKLDLRAMAPGDLDETDDLLEALANVERPENVTAMIRDLDDCDMRWALLELAGVMGLTEVADVLVDLLACGDDVLVRASVESLARIRSENTVAAIAARYPRGSRRFRSFALSVLKAVKLDSSESLLRDLAGAETDPALRARVFDALRFHFTAGSERLLRQELENPSSWMLPEAIAKALYVFGELRGASAPPPPFEGDEIYFHLSFEERDEPAPR